MYVLSTLFSILKSMAKWCGLIVSGCRPSILYFVFVYVKFRECATFAETSCWLSSCVICSRVLLYWIRVAIEIVGNVLSIETSTRCNGSAACRLYILLLFISMCTHASYLDALHWITKWLRSNGQTWVRILCFSCSWLFFMTVPLRERFLIHRWIRCPCYFGITLSISNLGYSMHLILIGLES
jgi:hypothetical protein